MSDHPILDRISGPADMKALGDADLARLAHEVRAEVINVVRSEERRVGKECCR